MSDPGPLGDWDPLAPGSAGGIDAWIGHAGRAMQQSSGPDFEVSPRTGIAQSEREPDARWVKVTEVDSTVDQAVNVPRHAFVEVYRRGRELVVVEGGLYGTTGEDWAEEANGQKVKAGTVVQVRRGASGRWTFLAGGPPEDGVPSTTSTTTTTPPGGCFDQCEWTWNPITDVFDQTEVCSDGCFCGCPLFVPNPGSACAGQTFKVVAPCGGSPGDLKNCTTTTSTTTTLPPFPDCGFCYWACVAGHPQLIRDDCFRHYYELGLGWEIPLGPGCVCTRSTNYQDYAENDVPDPCSSDVTCSSPSSTIIYETLCRPYSTSTTTTTTCRASYYCCNYDLTVPCELSSAKTCFTCKDPVTGLCFCDDVSFLIFCPMLCGGPYADSVACLGAGLSCRNSTTTTTTTTS